MLIKEFIRQTLTVDIVNSLFGNCVTPIKINRYHQVYKTSYKPFNINLISELIYRNLSTNESINENSNLSDTIEFYYKVGNSYYEGVTNLDEFIYICYKIIEHDNTRISIIKEYKKDWSTI